MPYLLFLKNQQNLKLSSAANYRWRLMGQVQDPDSVAACKTLDMVPEGPHHLPRGSNFFQGGGGGGGGGGPIAYFL